MEPLYTFSISDPTNIAAFVFFVIMAVFVSNVAGISSHSGHCGGNTRPHHGILYAFSRKLAGVGTLDDVLGPLPTRPR